MKTLDGRARARPRRCSRSAGGPDREVVCVLTDMDQPLGRAVGNALEVREALATLRGDGPPDFTELVLDSAAHLLALSDLGIDDDEGRRRAEQAVADGSAHGSVRAVGPRAGRRPRRARLAERAVVREVVRTARDGVRRPVSRALAVRASPRSTSAPDGATKDDPVDHAVGIVCLAQAGRRGEPGRRPRGGARPRRPIATRGRGRRARGVRDRRRAAEPRPIVLETSSPPPGRRPGLALRLAVPELPEVETVRRRLEPVLVGRTHRARRDPDSATRPPVRAGRGGGRARGRAGRRGRAARQVSDCSVRERSRSPGAPPDDGELPPRPARDLGETTRTGALFSA